MIKPPRPLGNNWEYFTRLNEWRVKPAPPERALPPLPGKVKHNPKHIRAANGRRIGLTQDDILAGMKSAGKEWMTVVEIADFIDRNHRYTCEVVKLCHKAGKLVMRTIVKLYGTRPMPVPHYKLKAKP